MQASTQLSMTENRDRSTSYRFFCFMNLAIWLVTTVVIRLWGHRLFISESNLSMVSSFLLSLLLVPLLVYTLFRWQQVPPHQCGEAAICLTLPGILLDAVATYFFAQIFPNLSPAADGAMGAWLLWGNALILITGFILGQKSKSEMV